MDIDPEEYLSNRLDNQIQWYDKKSQHNKKCFHFWQTLSMISGSLIPISTTLSTINNLRMLSTIATTILGAGTVLCQSILSVFNYHDHWVEYRKTVELLRKEEYMFLTKTGVYRNAELPFSDMVERVETIISNENINWTNLTANKKENDE